MLCHRGRSPDSTLQPRCSFADRLVPQMESALFAGLLPGLCWGCSPDECRLLMQTTLRKSQHNPGTPLVNIGTMVCFYVRYLLVCFYVRSTGINYVQLFSSSKYGLSAYFHFLSRYGFSFRLTPEHNLYYVNAICVNKTYVYMSNSGCFFGNCHSDNCYGNRQVRHLVSEVLDVINL